MKNINTISAIKNAKILCAIIVVFILFSFSSQAQVSQEWLNRYDAGGTSDIARGVVTDSAGFVYVTGYGGALGNTNIITIKYNASGQIIWTKNWNGPGNSYDEPNAILIRGNALYITGYSETGALVQSNRRKDFATLKYDLSGNLLWAAYYNFSSTSNWEDISYAIDVDAQLNVYVTGSSKSAAPQFGYRDIATIKYDVSGNQQWVVRYNAPGANGAVGTDDDIPVALHLDLSGNVYVTGSSVGANSGTDYVTLKYNSSGVNLWEKRYTMPGNFADVPYAMKLDASANVYVTGASSGYAVDPGLWYDYATIKYNSNGDTLWVRRFNSGFTAIPWDEARDVAIDDAGNVYVTGFVPSTTTTGDDFYTLKYDPNGNILWQTKWDGLGYGDHPSKMKLDAAGNIYITGYSKKDGSTAGNDYGTIKIDNNGQVQWAERYDGTNGTIDNAYDITVNPDGSNIYVTGQSYGFSDDYVTIKYVQPVAVSCETPAGLSVSKIKATSAKLTWTTSAGANSYLVQYRKSGANKWKTRTAISPSRKLNNLSPSTAYEAKVASVCTGDTSDYSEIQTFTTLPMREGEMLYSEMLLTVHPNPATTDINMDLSEWEGMVRLEIFDITGKLLKAERREASNDVKLNISSMKSGMHLLRVTDEDGMSTSFKWLKD